MQQFFSCDIRCNRDLEYTIGQRPRGVIRLIRPLPDVSCRGTEVAAALGRLLYAGIVVLVVTVGTLAAGSRLPTFGQYASTWHTAKIARVAENDNDEAAPLQIEDFWSYPRDVIPEPRPYSLAPNLPNLTGAFPQQVLRVPPRA